MKVLFRLFTSTLLSFQSLVRNGSKQFLDGSVHPFNHRHSISNKISYGYALTLMIAVVGTTFGIIIGEQYQKQAREREDYAQQEIRFLHRLGTTILQMQIHQQQFIYSLNKQKNWQKEHSYFIKYANESNQILSDFIVFKNHRKNSNIEKSFEKNEKEKTLQIYYQQSLKNYIQKIERIVKKINQYSLNPEELEAAKKLILEFNQDPQYLKINHLSDELAEFLKIAYQEEEEAEDSFNAAGAFRVRIIAASILLSVAIAILLAFHNTRMIARPIQTVTTVAQQVIQDGNFDLQTPVTTEDEIGVLAVSLNSLIRWVAKYTQELELARQTLEMRVEERTQELSQKNQQLLQTHNQLNQALHNLQQTQVQLIQTEKMASLGQMVAGIAHEINNPLSFISNNLEYANNYAQHLLELLHLYQQQYPHPTPDIQEHIEAIEFDFLVKDMPNILSSMEIGTERIYQLVLSLRNFSRLDEAEIKSVNLHEGLESTLLILNHQLKHEIEVIKQYRDLPLIECYPAQLNQVFMNTLQNAIDALQETADKPNKQILIKTQRVASNQIQVRIKDNGSGIPTEIKNKIFNPFFTTKKVGKGTGLGLSISYQIINKHQGKIEVDSQVGQGTEFVISIPIKQSASPPSLRLS